MSCCGAGYGGAYGGINVNYNGILGGGYGWGWNVGAPIEGFRSYHNGYNPPCCTYYGRSGPCAGYYPGWH